MHHGPIAELVLHRAACSGSLQGHFYHLLTPARSLVGAGADRTGSPRTRLKTSLLCEWDLCQLLVPHPALGHLISPAWDMTHVRSQMYAAEEATAGWLGARSLKALPLRENLQLMHLQPLPPTSLLRPAFDASRLSVHSRVVAPWMHAWQLPFPLGGLQGKGVLTTAGDADAGNSMAAELPFASRRKDRRRTEVPAHCIRLCRLESWLTMAFSCSGIQAFTVQCDNIHDIPVPVHGWRRLPPCTGSLQHVRGEQGRAK